MATWAHHKEFADFEKLRKNIQGGGIWIHRPLIIHERSTDGKKCGCGCDSRIAVEVERRELADVLIDPATGVRRVRQRVKPEHLAVWDELAAGARKIYLPHRVSRGQLAAMECEAKILACFGGVRGGKTQHIAECVVTELVLEGGYQTEVWWVAPTLPKTTLGLKKLVLGESVGRGKLKRFSPPILPPELVAYFPTSTRSERLYVELIDGSRVHFKYASDDGGSLKGDSPNLIVMDEGCEVRNRSAYQQCVERLMESGGQLLISTTPKAGHYFKADIYDKGVRVEDAQPGDEIAWTHLVAWDNPWVATKEIERTIKTFGDDKQRIRREVYGEWVGSGPLLWRHFAEADHVITSADYRVPADIGLVDVTPDAVRHFFLGQVVDRYLGQDFNLHPMSAVELQVATHPDDPDQLPIVIVPDEVVKKVGTIYEFIDELKRRGYAGAGVSCDASGAQFNSHRLAHGIKDKNSTQALELQRKGFPCQPCHVSDAGNAVNPGQLERVSVLHRLQMERIDLPDGSQYPRFLIHERAAKTKIALMVQESDSRGNPVKESNTVSDRVSGPADGLGYGTYAIADFLFPDSASGAILQ